MQRDLDAARAQGLITRTRQNELMQLAVRHHNSAAQAVTLQRHELINLSRQIQDVGVSLASGQSPFTVLVQQGTQVGDIFANSNTTLRGFLSQLRSMVSPVTLVTGGVIALGAAAYAAFQSWKNFALQLDDTAKVMGVTSNEAAKLQAAASFKGIGQADFAAGMATFSRNVYEARNGMGGLAETFRANNIQARTFDEFLARAADLIQRANGDTQKQFSL